MLEGLPLATTFHKAKALGIPYREYRPDKGESWTDVMTRGKKFLSDLAEAYVFGKPTHAATAPSSAGTAGTAGEETKQDPVVELAADLKKKLELSPKKAPLVHKEKPKKPTGPKSCPKVLAVTHGGFIMEFLNVYRDVKGSGVSEKNVAKNTSIYVIRVECAGCKGRCTGACGGKRGLAMKLLVENDNTHLTKK